MSPELCGARSFVVVPATGVPATGVPGNDLGCWMIVLGFGTILGMTSEKLTKRRQQLRNLVVMALADGSLGEREVNLVADRCAELGLDEYDLQKAVEFGLRDDAALELPSDQSDRESLLQDLIRMMAADGRLEEGEKRLFALAAAKMSMTTADVDRLIDKTLE